MITIFHAQKMFARFLLFDRPELLYFQQCGQMEIRNVFFVMRVRVFEFGLASQIFFAILPFYCQFLSDFFFIVHFTQFYRVFRAFYRHSLSLSHQKHDKSFIFTIDLVISFQTSQNSITFLMFITWALLMGNIFYVANLQKQNSM